MNLCEEDVQQFYKLYHSLLYYVNTKFGVTVMKSPDKIIKTSLKDIELLREELYGHPEMINQFINENPFRFSSDELGIIREWNNFLKGKFIILRSLKKYTIFLDSEEPPKAYGVLTLSGAFEEVLGPLPAMVEAVLLPFKGKIIFDGIIKYYPVTIGSGYRRSLNDTYESAKLEFGIIESLPFLEKGKRSDEDRLKFCLKSEKNQDMY